jgi:hypothetical protein
LVAADFLRALVASLVSLCMGKTIPRLTVDRGPCTLVAERGNDHPGTDDHSPLEGTTMQTMTVPAQPHVHALLSTVPEGATEESFMERGGNTKLGHVVAWIVTGEDERPIPVITIHGPDPEGDWTIVHSTDCKHGAGYTGLGDAVKAAKTRAWKLSTGTDLFDRAAA